MVMSRRKIAKEIVEVIREKKDITKNKLIQEVSKRQGVGVFHRQGFVVTTLCLGGSWLQGDSDGTGALC
jgi:hypothetical protein